ncbi:hypothetical protein Tco_0308205 [Tanacetum coccineum]
MSEEEAVPLRRGISPHVPWHRPHCELVGKSVLGVGDVTTTFEERAPLILIHIVCPGRGSITQMLALKAACGIMSADVARSHGGDGGGEDRPPSHNVPTGCMGCFVNRGKGKRKPNLGGRAAGRLNTRDKTRNLALKEITDYNKAPVDHGCAFVLPFLAEGPEGAEGDAHYRYWDPGFDLEAAHECEWTETNVGSSSTCKKRYKYQKGCLQGPALVIVPHDLGLIDVDKIGGHFLRTITQKEWVRIPVRLLALRDEDGEIALRDTPLLIDTFFTVTYSLTDFLQDEDRRYLRGDEDGWRLLGPTLMIRSLLLLGRGGGVRVVSSEAGHIPGVGWVLPARAIACPSRRRSGGCGDDEENADEGEEEDGDSDS